MKFAKVHGLGNDYVLINAMEEKIDEKSLPELTRKVSDRHFG